MLLDSDIIRLNDCFELGGTTLTDIPLDINHSVTAEGLIVLGAMQAGHTVKALRQLATRNGIDDRQLNELFGFLNLIGGLRRHKRTAAQFGEAVKKQAQALLLGIRYAGLSFRSRFTPVGLAAGVCRAVWPVVAATALVGTELTASGLLPRYAALRICLAGTATFVLSIYLHELGHVLVLGPGDKRLHVMQRRMHIGVIHAQRTPRVEILSALAGPLAGIAAASAIGSCLWIAGLGHTATAAYFVSLFHLFSLLPWQGDGQSLSDALHGKRSIR